MEQLSEPGQIDQCTPVPDTCEAGACGRLRVNCLASRVVVVLWLEHALLVSMMLAIFLAARRATE